MTALAWAEADPDVVDQRLERLGARVPARSGHARAASIECLVADVALQVLQARTRRPRPGRPVLVMIG